MNTPLLFLGEEFDNRIYVKREDLFPFSLGGNKARIAREYFREIDAGNYSCVVTCGGAGSNLCRVVADLAAARGLRCVLILHTGQTEDSFNRKLAALSGAETVLCPPERMAGTIDARLEELRSAGERPFFIPGGGRGVPGTRAYADCYREIRTEADRAGLAFAYMIVPSGTGTTQAGLVCGKLLAGDPCRIVGISIARSAETGRPVILNNVRDYFSGNQLPLSERELEEAVIFEDAYTGGGYGRGDYSAVIRDVWNKYGMPLDNTYTAKAFRGMGEYLRSRGVIRKNILFINTGGIPLLFDDLLRMETTGGGEKQ